MKNKKLFLLPVSILLSFAISSCGSSLSSSQESKPNSSSNSETSSINETSSSSENSSANAGSSSSSASSANSSSSKPAESSYMPDYNDQTIYFIIDSTLSNGSYDSSKDEYTFSINKNYKQIYVNAPEKTIIVELDGATIENNENSPIFVQDCDGIEISAKKNSVNYIKDTRAACVEENSSQGGGAIYVANGDLKLKGNGTLNIAANYYNGIHCKDDVKVQKQTLNITAINHGIKGNDSVTITSGTIDILCGGDGLHSDNSGISSKDNQKGNVTINGGTLTINSWCDAVQAAYDAVFEQTDNTVPIAFTARTNKYSSYAGEVVETSTSNLYLKLNSSTYSSGAYTYAALINDTWYPAAYKGTQSNGGTGGPGGQGGKPGQNNTYHIYQLSKPNAATSFTLYRFEGSNVTTFSTETYNAKSDAKAFNNAYDTVQISVSGSRISFSSWSNYSSGNNNSADVSAKGIKAENEINIKAGTIDIKAYDDAIHANNDGTLENGSAPLGNVNISGGELTLSASDDAVHADGELTISGGTTNITSSYEGLEGNVININGGSTYVYGTDDGVNATSGKKSPAIKVSGGFLDVEVPTSGDTDGIDSNGTYTQTGGTVIIKGPGSASGGMGGGAAALDTDGTVALSDGTLIVFGGIERTPSTSLTKTICSSNSVSTGSHSVSFSNGTSYSTTLKSSSRGCVVYSSLGSATLK